MSEYRILIAHDKADIYALAGADWHVLTNTIRQFQKLDCDDDQAFGDIGGVLVDQPGWVALAVKT